MTTDHSALMRANAAIAIALACLVCRVAECSEPDVLVIKAGRILTVNGDPIDNGSVLIRDGRIEAVGRDIAIPPGARVMERADGVLTPGLIDACCVVDSEIAQGAATWSHSSTRASLWQALAERALREHDDPDDQCDPDSGSTPLASAIAPLATWGEHSAEVTPHRLVLDSVNLLSHDFGRLMRGGVTTVYVSADSANVIGARGTILRTAGPLGERVVRRADAVKAVMGGDPSDRGQRNYLPPYYGPPPSVLTRRPTTRMGVDWVFRKAFYDAQRARAGLELHGADMPPVAAIPILQQILEGEVPLRIQARMQHDIFSALRLAGEFNLKFTLEEATEAYRCLPQLKAAGVPVIFGPLYMTAAGYRGRTDEVSNPRLNSPRQLADAGIEFALTAQELRDEEGLVRQGMLAAQNGLSTEQALRAITATPATLLGLGGEQGVVAPGATADLVVWSAEPFDPASRPLLVVINGRIVSEQK